MHLRMLYTVDILYHLLAELILTVAQCDAFYLVIVLYIFLYMQKIKRSGTIK